MLKEFKEFAMRGNVLDLAIAVIIGAAFAPIIASLVDNIIMPPVGYLLAGVDFSNLAITIQTNRDPIEIQYGLFINAVIKFLITAFAIFMLIKVIKSFEKQQEEAAPPAPPQTEVYLKEIRDLLAKQS